MQEIQNQNAHDGYFIMRMSCQIKLSFNNSKLVKNLSLLKIPLKLRSSIIIFFKENRFSLSNEDFIEHFLAKTTKSSNLDDQCVYQCRQKKYFQKNVNFYLTLLQATSGGV